MKWLLLTCEQHSFSVNLALLEISSKFLGGTSLSFGHALQMAHQIPGVAYLLTLVTAVQVFAVLLVVGCPNLYITAQCARRQQDAVCGSAMQQ